MQGRRDPRHRESGECWASAHCCGVGGARPTFTQTFQVTQVTVSSSVPYPHPSDLPAGLGTHRTHPWMGGVLVCTCPPHAGAGSGLSPYWRSIWWGGRLPRRLGQVAVATGAAPSAQSALQAPVPGAASCEMRGDPTSTCPWQATRWGRRWRAAQVAGTPPPSLAQGPTPRLADRRGPSTVRRPAPGAPTGLVLPLASKPRDTGKLCLPSPSGTI